MNQAELIKKQIVTCSNILCAIVLLSFSKQVGSNAMAYLGVALLSVHLFLLFCYHGVADMIGRMIRGKKSKGFYKDAVQVRKRVMFLQALTGFVLMAVCFLIAPFLCDKVFMIPYGLIPLQILSVMVFLHSLEAMFGGYFQSVGSFLPEAIGNVLRILFTLVFGKLFAGKMSYTGERVSALLMNDDFAGMYGAIGLSIGFVIAETLVVIFYLFLYLISDKVGERKRAASGHQKTESMQDTCRYYYSTLITIAVTNLLLYMPMFALFFFQGRKTENIYSNAYLMGELVGRLFPVAVLFVLLFALRIHILLTKIGAHVRKQEYRVVAEYIGAGIHYTWCMGVYVCVMLLALSEYFTFAFFADATRIHSVMPIFGLFVFAFVLFFFVVSVFAALKEHILLFIGGGLCAVISILYYALAGKGADLCKQAMFDAIFAMLLVGIIGAALLVWKYQVRIDYVRVFVIPLFSVALTGLLCIFLAKLLTPHMGNAASFVLCSACGLVVHVSLLSVTKSVQDTEVSCLYGNFGKKILGLIFR